MAYCIEFHGTEASLSHGRVFGCRAFVNVTMRKRFGKFQPRIEEGVFIEYNRGNFYRVVDPTTGAVTIFQDAELIGDSIEVASSTPESIQIEMPNVDYITPNDAAEGDQEQHKADSDAVDTSEGQTTCATDQ